MRLGKQSPGKEVGYRRGWSRGGRIAASLFEYPIDECAEFQLLENLAEFLFVRFFADERIHIEPDGNICFDGGKEFGEGYHLAVGFHFRFQCAFQLVGMFQQVFDTAEFGNQFLCGFLAHTRTAGMLSEASPISPSMSMTCSVVCMLNFVFTLRYPSLRIHQCAWGGT